MGHVGWRHVDPAARTRSPGRISEGQILFVAPFLILLTAFVGQVILAEASLSCLGLGVQEPTPAWGLLLQGGAEEYASTAPWIAIFRGVAIVLTVFGFSLFGDALCNAIDSKLREG